MKNEILIEKIESPLADEIIKRVKSYINNKETKKFKKLYYLLPNGKIIKEIIPFDSEEKDLTVIGRYIINEVGAIVG